MGVLVVWMLGRRRELVAGEGREWLDARCWEV
jgi:hypothetical protein